MIKAGAVADYRIAEAESRSADGRKRIFAPIRFSVISSRAPIREPNTELMIKAEAVADCLMAVADG